ncbi:hypothetical protein C446_09945 [Halobiforma nitratireducens JCM 10879]|uniref:Uncharacterized protein n=1 Tax=Halobiforma nitratireducens JCM 10879 TaxID=1227454 RepID=M0LZF6_9EURY|nr:hypothetical protein C446_09945 [Halobiforma nitratireducens JCM 10879]
MRWVCIVPFWQPVDLFSHIFGHCSSDFGIDGPIAINDVSVAVDIVPNIEQFGEFIERFVCFWSPLYVDIDTSDTFQPDFSPFHHPLGFFIGLPFQLRIGINLEVVPFLGHHTDRRAGLLFDVGEFVR